ncbi:UDP-glycosyltransferase 73C25-like [Mangifera indica]|uniref:UDP-glycosyltransferase 73C25-like n=1 Tax=Mangifera indica TaxID=29780 RepID=UPI001CF99828|nr:UDP-glycosyltransferase 73C25-like [Mangifera indica]
MGSQSSQLHFVLLPFLAQGHLIPMVDIAKLLARQGVMVTIVTTPINAARFETFLARAIQSGQQIQLIELSFPCEEAGLPEGFENFDLVTTIDLAANFFNATGMLELPFENLFRQLTPRPSCVISDMCYPWTTKIASKFNVPRITFYGFSCFCHLCMYNLLTSKVHENITSDHVYFVVPGLPDKIEMTKAQLPEALRVKNFSEKISASEMASYGVVINTFEELESAYVNEYKKAKNGKVWCIGPVSACNKDNVDKVHRGNRASVDGSEFLKWLDSWQPSSVIYVCLGSLCNLATAQLIDLGLGLEASKKPFIWVIKEGIKSRGLEEWLLEEKFEERIKRRGLLIRGWAPQILILSHPAIGGFLTHCGWNSLTEGISAGVPTITWPLFADQFCNEKLIVQVLKIGVEIGVEVPLTLGKEEEIGVLVKKEDVEKAVNILMDEGEEKNERRRRATEFAEMANRAIEEGGSSYINMALLIQDIMQQANCCSPN